MRFLHGGSQPSCSFLLSSESHFLGAVLKYIVEHGCAERGKELLLPHEELKAACGTQIPPGYRLSYW